MAVRFEYACKPLSACAEIHRWILMNVCDAEISSGVKILDVCRPRVQNSLRLLM